MPPSLSTSDLHLAFSPRGSTDDNFDYDALREGMRLDSSKVLVAQQSSSASMSQPTQEMRRPGRPGQSYMHVGKDRILESTRDVLRSKSRVDITRADLAAAAKVTPALVSYYYPDKWVLIEDAIRPIITLFIDSIVEILGSESELDRKIFATISLYVKFNSQHGRLLDFFVEHQKRFRRREDVIKLEGAQENVKRILIECMKAGFITECDPTSLHSILWGAAQGSTLIDPFLDQPLRQISCDQIELAIRSIYKLFVIQPRETAS